MTEIILSRRQLLAVGGVAAVGGPHRLLPFSSVSEAGSAAGTLRRAVSTAFASARRHFYDPETRAIRPTNGGNPLASNGLIDSATESPSLWQRESFANIVFNEWTRTGDEGFRRVLLDDWAATKVRYTPEHLVGLPSGAGHYRLVNTFDDACWLCSYLMHAHMAGAEDAIGYLVEAIAYNTSRFTDPDTASNPATTFMAQTPNLPGIAFPQRTVNAKQTMTGSRFGSLYSLPDASNFGGAYGKCSSSFESVMGLAALYVYERLSYPGMRNYAIHAQNLIRNYFLTPDPRAVPADPAHTPTMPTDRKAQYLVETELCLSTEVRSNDPYAAMLRPRNQWYGKPVRSLDSTYLGGALSYCLLSARLYRLGLGDRYRRDALNSANAIISLQGYGRVVGGVTLVTNSRDPHSEGHWAVGFASEVLTLPGASPAIRKAFVDTGLYIATQCLTPDGYVMADWAGPERNPFTGRSTWDEDYTALPGGQAGHVQIMTTSESIAMLQACALAAI